MPNSTPTVGSSTYARIKHDIIFGILEPGAKLKLDALKARYDASLSTLRETLNRLVSDGFVEAPAQRGFLVKPVSRADMEEIAELRILLETHALRLSIANGDTEWEGNLVAAHHKLHVMEERMRAGEESEKETWKRYDWEFHLAMIAACGSQNLMSLHRTLFDKYQRYQNLVLTYRGEIAAREHKVMFEAALDRKPQAAAEMLEEHVRKGLAHTLAALD
ncbi:GntR family transcriptional regulator [Litorisediminicola beolgyonensis]|uniref:GntR family transcriptional regulator n=1 Tax=Litorisediminicola beolgyonensis TaxID=1173614 RepID=A0ABW3ZE94_9RHOB